MKDLSLYIHIPFCKQKCYYCDFLSFSNEEDTVSIYFDALNREINNTPNTKDEYLVKTIFIGGGTPTYVHFKYIIKVIETIKNNFSVDPEAEISIESNPGTCNIDSLYAYKNIGINRLSIGLQCWQNNLLKNIGRIHTHEEFVNSYINAKQVGFTNINIDLIFGLPNQSISHWMETLYEVCKLEPTHLSCYSLKLEEGTVLYKSNLSNQFTIDEELDRHMYYYSIEYLNNSGYYQYEISNFAKPNMECNHNLVYWELKPYIGLGLGAHSYFEGYRYSNEENIKQYIHKIQNGDTINTAKMLLSVEDMKAEFIFLGLRKIHGIYDKFYRRMFNSSFFDDYEKEINQLVKEDYIIITDGNLKLSKKGLDFANFVFMSFLND
ncbi:radical SAM family heme chaperone HemW [Alkalibaculum sporogenes]|uniref:radical SAM family heme chaperone HemW n=1 Tax=Alkalibaculum sporogenes TaxID=2655001 RepID=UPI00128E81D7|nr:radical SAM family heme chaperone HemW [Alkalibaculum sporogenes]